MITLIIIHFFEKIKTYFIIRLKEIKNIFVQELILRNMNSMLITYTTEITSGVGGDQRVNYTANRTDQSMKYLMIIFTNKKNYIKYYTLQGHP